MLSAKHIGIRNQYQKVFGEICSQAKTPDTLPDIVILEASVDVAGLAIAGTVFTPTRLPGTFPTTGGIAIPDNLSTTIHSGAQGKHIPGHNSYDLTKNRSILTANPNELLSGVHSGQYQIVRIGGGKPLVNFGKPIGTYGGNGPVTQYGYVHYGKIGAHIVPANPNQF